MYRDSETDFSRNYLKEIVRSLQKPFCLMGGWSVFLILNERFRDATGREYPGSKDIDLGFHLDPTWTAEEFKKSAMGKAISKIVSMGFEPRSFRFVKPYHLSERRELTPDEKRRLPQYEMFSLYIDMLVDSQDPRRLQVAGFDVLDEPLLARVFSGADSLTASLNGVEVVLPDPRLLMGMKLKSFPGRTADDKRTKDLIDLVGLLSYSGFKPPILSGTQGGQTTLHKFERALGRIGDDEWGRVANSLGMDEGVARRTVRLIR